MFRGDGAETSPVTDVLALMVLFVLGCCVGSFGNVLVWRVPKRVRAPDELDRAARRSEGEAESGARESSDREAGILPSSERAMSIVAPGSYCPHCRHPLAWYENVPVVSWLALRGRCRHCRARIPARYPLVELATGGLWVMMAVRFGWSWELPAFLALSFGLVVLSAIDLELYLLPNKIVYPLGYALAALLLLAAVATGEWGAFGRAVGAGAAAFAAFFALHVIAPRGMGFGDVRFSFVLGLALGWLGWAEVFLGFFLAFALGAVIGLALMALRLRSRKQPIPFGEFMALGAVIVILWGEPMVEAWLAR